MAGVRTCPLPECALLRRYDARGHVDCHAVDVALAVSQAQYVAAFYTTGLFKAERLVLRALGMPSDDAEVAQLASGACERFAAWTVEARTPGQLLMRDVNGVTRSWLMAEPLGAAGTRLYFGSAVEARPDPATGELRLGAMYRRLMGMHLLYSRALLAAARRRAVRLARQAG